MSYIMQRYYGEKATVAEQGLKTVDRILTTEPALTGLPKAMQLLTELEKQL